jgi:hypothetical protein
MKTATKKFDAVTESRKWKEKVAAETEGLSCEDTLKFFDRQIVNERFREALERANQDASSSQ